MQNLLIVEDDLIQSHFLANSICKEISDARVYNIASTGSEAIDIIKEEKVDIIILDLKLPDMTGIDIINYISSNNIVKYSKSVFVLTGEMELLSKIVKNKCIFNYSSKIKNIDYIISQIKNLIEQKEKNICEDKIKEEIKKELEILKFDFSYMGNKYLYECIYQCFFKTNIYNINFKKDIYPIISSKYHKTVNSIKTNIFQATSIMYYEINNKELSDYFGYKIINKPKTKDVVFAIVEKLKSSPI